MWFYGLGGYIFGTIPDQVKLPHELLKIKRNDLFIL